MLTDNKPKSPCYRCEERNAECHSICERYKAWSEDIKRINEGINFERMRALQDPRWSNKTSSKYNRIKKQGDKWKRK